MLRKCILCGAFTSNPVELNGKVICGVCATTYGTDDESKKAYYAGLVVGKLKSGQLSQEERNAYYAGKLSAQFESMSDSQRKSFYRGKSKGQSAICVVCGKPCKDNHIYCYSCYIKLTPAEKDKLRSVAVDDYSNAFDMPLDF